jgi:hypothetical protein
MSATAVNRAYRVDLNNPTISNVRIDGAAFPTGTVYRNGAFVLTYDIADTFDLASFTVTRNGTDITPALPDLTGPANTSDTLTINVGVLASGTYQFLVTLTDGAGRTASDTKMVTVDRDAPAAEVISVTPFTGTNTVNGNVSIKMAASDNYSVSAIRWWVLGEGATPAWGTAGFHEITSPPYEANFDTATVVDGTYDIIVMAQDAAQNDSTLLAASRKTIVISQASDNPVIDVTNMDEGGTEVANLQGGGAKIVGTLTDDDMVDASTLQLLLEYWNGTGWDVVSNWIDIGSSYADAKSVNFQYEFGATLANQGRYRYRLRVTDLASAKLQLPTAKGAVTTTLPESGYIAFAYDTADPGLTIEDASDAWHREGFVLNGTAQDSYGLKAVQYSVDGGTTWTDLSSWTAPYPSSSQAWSYDLSTHVPNLFDGAHEGTQTWQIRSVDAFDKTTVTSFVFKVDTTASSAGFSSPAANSYFLSTTGTVQGTASDTGSGINAVYYAVAASEPTIPAVADRLDDGAWGANGWSKANGSDPWVANLTGLVEGNRTVHIRSVDRAGNMSATAVNRAYRVDLSSPSFGDPIRITDDVAQTNFVDMPAGIVYRGIAFSLRYDLADAFDIASVSITQKLNAGATLTIPITSTSNPNLSGASDVAAVLTVADLPRNTSDLTLYDGTTSGTYTYVVTLTDGAGRTATISKEITVDVADPEISIASFNKFVTGNQVNGTVTFTTSAFDASGIAAQRYFITSTAVPPTWNAVEDVGNVVDILAGTSIDTTNTGEYTDGNTYYLYVMAQDNSGRTAACATPTQFQINQASDRPILDLDSTVNDTVFDASGILAGGNVFDGADRISGIVTDDDAIASITISVWNDLGTLVVDNAACTLGGTSTNRSFYYELGSLVDDTYYFVIDAIDDHGIHNLAMAPNEVWFAVDNALPSITNDHIRLENRYATSVAVTAVNATDTFTTGAAHGLTAGDAVMFDSTLYGVNAATKYYVRSAGLTSTTFTVATSRGGALVPLTGDGAGLSIQYITKNAAAMPNAKLYNNFRVYVQAADAAGIDEVGIVLEGYGNYATPQSGSFINESGNLWYYDVAIDEGGHADDGSLTMTITATDIWGKDKEAVLQVTIDTRSPEPSFSSFVNNQAVNGDAVPVIGTINDPSPGVGVAYWNITGGLLGTSLASGTGNSWNTTFNSNTYANASNATVDGVPVTVDTDADTFDMVDANGIANGDEVYFYAGTYPDNIAYGTVYYVINFNSGTNSFQVSANKGGTTPVDLGGSPASVVVREGGIRWLFPVTTTCFDVADNRDNPSLNLYLDPISDRPRIGDALVPTAGSYSGAITIIGSVNDDDMPDYVEVCVDLNDDGVITAGLYPYNYGGTPGTNDAFEEEDNPLVIDMTGYSFSDAVNEANEFSRAIMEARGVAGPGLATGNFRLRFIAYDVNGTASNPVWVSIYLDDAEPVIGGLNYEAGSSGTLVRGQITLSGYVEDDSELDESNLRFNFNNTGYTVAASSFTFDAIYSGMNRYNFTRVIQTADYDGADDTGTVKVGLRVMDDVGQYTIQNVNLNADNNYPSGLFDYPNPSLRKVGALYDFNGPGGTRPGSSVSINPATNLITSVTNHGLEADDPVYFYTSGGSLPTGVLATTVFYVRGTAALTSTTFEVSTTVDGPAFDFTDIGSNVYVAKKGVNDRFIGSATDTGTISGIDYILVYFVKNGNTFWSPRRSGVSTSTTGNTAVVRGTDIDLNFDGDAVDTGENVGVDATIPVAPLTLDPVGMVTATYDSLATDRMSLQCSALVGNMDIQPGWIIEFTGGTQRSINAFNNVSGTVSWLSPLPAVPADASIHISHLLYSVRIDKRTELGSYDNVAGIGDGDGFQESLKPKTGYDEWLSYFDTSALPEGPITLYFLVYDEAGNRVYNTADCQVTNHPPTITSVDIDAGGTDYTGLYKVDTTLYLRTNASDEEGIQAGTYQAELIAKRDAVSGASTTAGPAIGTTYASFYTGNALNLDIRESPNTDFVSGIIYTMRLSVEDTDGNTALTDVEFWVNNNDTSAPLVSIDDFTQTHRGSDASPTGHIEEAGYSLNDGTAISAVITTSSKSSVSASSLISNGSIRSGYVAWFSTGEWRTLASFEIVSGTMTFTAALNKAPPVGTNVVLYPGASGTVTSQSTDKLSVVVASLAAQVDMAGWTILFSSGEWRTIAEYDDGTGYFRWTEPLDTDPGVGTLVICRPGHADISGTVNVTGRASDDSQVTQVQVRFNGGAWQNATVTPAGGNVISGYDYTWTYTLNTTDWDWDSVTAGTQVTGLDKLIEVQAYDGQNYGTTDEEGKDAEKIVDVLPYITQIARETPLKTNRSRNGYYSVYQGEGANDAYEITVSGYNLQVGTGLTSAFLFGAPQGSTTSFALDVETNPNYQSFTMNIPADAVSSGWFQVRANGLDAINNRNDNALAYNHIYGTDDDSSYWTDDRYIRVWDVGDFFYRSDVDYYGVSAPPQHPAMAINPSNSRLFGAWSSYASSDVFLAGANDYGSLFRSRLYHTYDTAETVDIAIDPSTSRFTLAWLGNNSSDGDYSDGHLCIFPYERTTNFINGDVYSDGAGNLPSDNYQWQRAGFYNWYYQGEGLGYAEQLFQFDQLRSARYGNNSHWAYYDKQTGSVKYGYVNSSTENSENELRTWISLDGTSDTDANEENYLVTNGVARVGTAGEFLALTLDEDNCPLVVYYNGTNQTLRIATSDQVNPTDEADWRRQTVLQSSDPNYNTALGKHISAVVDDNGCLHIAFWSDDTGYLYYIKSSNDPESGEDYEFDNPSQIVDDTGTAGMWSDITLDRTTNKPYISYLNSARIDTRDGLKVAYYDEARASWDYMVVACNTVVALKRTSIEYKRGGTVSWNAAVGYASSGRFEINYMTPEVAAP